MTGKSKEIHVTVTRKHLSELLEMAIDGLLLEQQSIPPVTDHFKKWAVEQAVLATEQLGILPTVCWGDGGPELSFLFGHSLQKHDLCLIETRSGAYRAAFRGLPFYVAIEEGHAEVPVYSVTDGYQKK